MIPDVLMKILKILFSLKLCARRVLSISPRVCCPHQWNGIKRWWVGVEIIEICQVCTYWLAGECTKPHCIFRHLEDKRGRWSFLGKHVEFIFLPGRGMWQSATGRPSLRDVPSPIVLSCTSILRLKILCLHPIMKCACSSWTETGSVHVQDPIKEALPMRRSTSSRSPSPDSQVTFPLIEPT